jgi:hypothetical protein
MTENLELSPPVAGQPTLPYLQFASILLNGLEKLAEIQKSALSIFTEMTRNSADAARPVLPALEPLFEMAEQAIREFLQIQVRLLDLMLSQSAAQMDEAQAHPGMDYELEVATLMRNSTDCLLTMQKKALEFILHQNEALAAAIEEPGGNGDAASNSDTSAIIEAQKKFWDVTLKPFKMIKAEFPKARRLEA